MTQAPKPATKGPAAYFPSIEKTYGKPITHWLDLVTAMGDIRHMEKVAILKADHGLGHGHANAIVAYSASLPPRA
jgi:citrate synthase